MDDLESQVADRLIQCANDDTASMDSRQLASKLLAVVMAGKFEGRILERAVVLRAETMLLSFLDEAARQQGVWMSHLPVPMASTPVPSLPVAPDSTSSVLLSNTCSS